MRVVPLLAAILAVLPLSASAQPTRQNDEREMVLTEEHNGKEISIAPSTTLIVKLPTQFGTGYSWQAVELPSTLLSPVGKPRVETTDARGAGRQDRQVFTFTPQKSGSASLKFHYVRPWEKDAKPEKTFSVKLTIE